jgi:DNA-binding response OmpR family regulator
MQSRRAVVLVVEQDADLRDRMGSWLEDDGHEVMLCPGPTHPDYVCVAGKGMRCVLTEMADVVILDLWLASDTALRGTSATRLVSYYLSSGKPVVALSSRRDNTSLFKRFLEAPLTVLDWPPERRDLCETTRALLADRPRPGGLDRGLSPTSTLDHE